MRISVLAFSVCYLLVSACAVQAGNPKSFTVKSATDDATFDLAEQRGKTVVLHFLLKTECPYCMRYTHEYAALAKKNDDVVHVFLKPDTEDEIKAWAGRLDMQGVDDKPRVYRDENAKLADAFEIPDGYMFHGQTVHYPALIILDGEGNEQFRYVGKSNADRISTKEFEEKLAALRRAQPK